MEKKEDEGPKFDSAGFSDADNQLSPPPDEIDFNTNQSMWVIDGHKIWASSYMEALQQLPIILNN
jgi:hypothetical protein